MKVINDSRKAQLVFIFMGAVLIVSMILYRANVISVQAIHLLSLAEKMIASLYFFYIGIAALISGCLPHANAILLFSSKQIVGVKARFLALFIVLCSLVFPILEIKSYLIDLESERLDLEIRKALE